MPQLTGAPTRTVLVANHYRDLADRAAATLELTTALNKAALSLNRHRLGEPFNVSRSDARQTIRTLFADVYKDDWQDMWIIGEMPISTRDHVTTYYALRDDGWVLGWDRIDSDGDYYTHPIVQIKIEHVDPRDARLMAENLRGLMR